MKKILIRIDAVFLAVSGSFGVASDLLSYFAGLGPFGGKFLGDPFVISGVEAHALAVLTSIAMWRLSTVRDSGLGNWLGAGAHLICGVSNTAWFGVFVAMEATAQGYAVTVIHFAFVLAHLIAILGSFWASDRSGKIASRGVSL